MTLILIIGCLGIIAILIIGLLMIKEGGLPIHIKEYYPPIYPWGEHEND